MAGGEVLGFMPMTGWGIISVMIDVFLVILIPGFLISWALFPKKENLRMSERLAMSLGLGLLPMLLLMIMNMALEVKVTFLTDLIVLLLVSIVAVVVFLYRGGMVKVGNKVLLKPMNA